jgi:branched-chain amino acid transport system substrate-binding protein
MAVPIPPDFTTFWNEAMSAGYHPKVATVAKAMLFPSNANALGDLCVNVCSEVWWSPTHPYKSSITKQSCQQLSNAYQKTTGNQWVATLGLNHAMFEVLFATLKKANSVNNAAIVKALSTLHINTIAGPVNWNSNPEIGGKALKNITVTPLVGGQWRASAPGSKFPYEQIVVTNMGFPHIPRGGNVQAIKYA